jgi:RNA polymerase sigma-70 factor (ECF subfamily)
VAVANDDDDAEVVRQCRLGNEQAYRQLIERYQPRIYSLAVRMVGQAQDAEDVTQETFVRMFRAIDRYDPARPFAAWLFTIASRLCIDHIRRRRSRPISLVQRETGSQDEHLIEVEDTGLKPDEIVSRAEEEQRAHTLVDSLPPHYRIVVMLRHQQDLSYEEISQVLHLPLGTVKARIHRARALLKERLEGEQL